MPAKLIHFIAASAIIASALTMASIDQAIAQPTSQCAQGYVWRMASPTDYVCVTPQAREDAAKENDLANERREPNGGAYGPNTCRPGFVWREAFPGDFICVPPHARTRIAEENRQGRANAAVTNAQPSQIPRGTVPGLVVGHFFADSVEPGIYNLRAQHSQLCIGTRWRGNGTQYLSAEGCVSRGANAHPLIAVVRESHPNEQQTNPFYTLRPIASLADANRFSNGQLCGGVAQGVVFGPEAIDVTACRANTGAPIQNFCQQFPDYAQTFQLFRQGGEQSHRYRIKMGGRENCVTVRGSSMDEGAEHIKWECHAEVAADNYLDQVFEFTYVAPLPARLAVCPDHPSSVP